MLQRLVRQLSAIADRAATLPTDSGTVYRFGARDIRLLAVDPQSRSLPDGGLVRSAGGREVVDVFVVDERDVSGLEFPADLRLAPYGAIIDSLQTDWLILRSPDTGTVLAFDRVQRRAIYYPGSDPAPRERAEFCRPLLHWLAVLDGNVVVHAGAVAVDDVGVLIAGNGNAGKSTLVRACLAAGHRVLGDNVVELGRDAAERPVLHAVYPTFKIRPEPVLPVPVEWPSPEWDDEAKKDIYFLGESHRDSFADASLVHAATLVLNPSAGIVPAPITSGDAFFQVAPNTVAQFPFFEREVLTRTGAAIGARPAFGAGRMPLAGMVGELERLAHETLAWSGSNDR